MGIPLPTFKCPFCRSIVTSQYVAGRPLTCQDCHRELQISRWYLNLAGWAAIGVTFIFCLLLGLRGLRLLIAAVVLWFPISLLCTFLLNRAIPPPLEPYVPKVHGVPKKPTDSGSHSSSLDLFDR